MKYIPVRFDQKVTNVGGSLGVVLPKQLCEMYSITKGTQIKFVISKTGRIRFSKVIECTHETGRNCELNAMTHLMTKGFKNLTHIGDISGAMFDIIGEKDGKEYVFEVKKGHAVRSKVEHYEKLAEEKGYGFKFIEVFNGKIKIIDSSTDLPSWKPSPNKGIIKEDIRKEFNPSQ